MTRTQLEHILRAAGAITNARAIVILGSQSILGSFPNAPEEFRQSMEADAFPLDDIGKADLIDGSIGELSPFHETHGYYAHGISPESTVLAEGWRERLVPVSSPATAGVTGYCLSPSDLAISKLAAGRDKDFTFVSAMLKHGFIRQNELDRISQLLSDSDKKRVAGNLALLREKTK
jgi:hypothetical protein